MIQEKFVVKIDLKNYLKSNVIFGLGLREQYLTCTVGKLGSKVCTIFKCITALTGFSFSCHQTQGRESIAAKLVANLITESGADRVLACDLHSGQSMGYFDIPVDHVYCQVSLKKKLFSIHVPLFKYVYLGIHILFYYLLAKAGHPRLSCQQEDMFW